MPTFSTIKAKCEEAEFQRHNGPADDATCAEGNCSDTQLSGLSSPAHEAAPQEPPALAPAAAAPAPEPAPAPTAAVEARPAAKAEPSQPAKPKAPPPPAKPYSQVTVFRSQQDRPEEVFSMVDSETLHNEGVGNERTPSVFVCPQHQVDKPWLGFGGAFTEASCVTLHRLSESKQDEVLRAYFDTETGLGYTLGRVHIGSCDFSLRSWTCGEVSQTDTELNGFSISRYRKAIIPMVKRAMVIANGPLDILASPWSPFPWMKTEPKFNSGSLKPEYWGIWAKHFVRFIQEFRQVGVPIWGVSVQNEPASAGRWESCVWTAEEERDFVRDHLGPALESSGLGSVKILVGDHNRDGMLERAAIIYGDPEAAKYVWGVGYHWYGDARFEAWPDRSEVYFPDRQQNWQLRFELKSRLGLENLKRVAELHPDKHILFTEGCQELSGVPLKAIQNEWMFGERYAMNIIADMNNGCEGWIDWNLFLDEQGGPNHVDNNCLAPIIYDTQKQEVIYTPPYIFLSHFSRFIRPEARRVLCSTSRDALEVTSFMNVDGSIVVVVLNRSSSEVDFKLKVAGEGADPVQAVQLTSPPSSIMTLVVE
mmetsp:Transcript_87572/g.271146  ORF Transcript_87572/g.271146 Transcript_87572/m.271146 type:complete len:592 (-) Transcript_87572:161-1936(-)